MQKEKIVEEVWVSLQDGSANAGATASHILRSLAEGKDVKIQYASTGKSKDLLILKSTAILRIMRRMLDENNKVSGKKDNVLVSLPYRSKDYAKGQSDKKISVNVVDVVFCPDRD